MIKAGWDIYFPHRDFGFDFIAIKQQGKDILIRPVQVKGKYPDKDKENWKHYGFWDNLSAVHRDMVLVIVYFSVPERSIDFIVYMPESEIDPQKDGRYKCEPAMFKEGQSILKDKYKEYADEWGLQRLDDPSWR
jgi:hypothetical protein